jgi:hypothetical protein
MERIAVQVKSESRGREWASYKEEYAAMSGFTRFHFVTHSTNLALHHAVAENAYPNFIFWGVEQLASQAARGGLTGGLLDKAL